VSLRRSVLVALLAATGAVAGGVGAEAHASGRASCGGATQFRGAPILQFGALRMAGFASQRCAWLKLDCGPKLGGYQAVLSLELPEPPASPIVLRARADEAARFFLVGSTTPAPKIPRCLNGRATRAKVSLHAPDQYFVLFVFAPRGTAFHLTATQGGHRLGAAVLSCRA